MIMNNDIKVKRIISKLVIVLTLWAPCKGRVKNTSQLTCALLCFKLVFSGIANPRQNFKKLFRYPNVSQS